MSQKYVATNQTCASIDRVTVNIWICHRYFFWYKVNIRHWGIRIVRSKCVAKSQPTISNICSGIPSSLNRVQTRTRHVFSNLLLSCTQGSVQWQAGCVRALRDCGAPDSGSAQSTDSLTATMSGAVHTALCTMHWACSVSPNARVRIAFPLLKRC